MESVLGGTFATFGNRLLYLDERLCLFKCINTQNHDLGQVKTGLNFLGWIMTLDLHVRTVVSLTEPGTKKETEPYGKANTGL